MLLKAKLLGLEADKPIIILNKEDAEDIDVRPLDRVELSLRGKKGTAIVNVATRFIKPGQIGLHSEIAEHMEAGSGDRIEISPSEPPESLIHIREKLSGNALKDSDIYKIVKDTVNRKLSEIEMTAFVTALYYHGMTTKEAAALSRAMAITGKKLDLGRKVVYDKHSVTWDTPVMIKEGGRRRLVKIGEFIDNFFKMNCKKIEKVGNRAEYIETEDADYEALSFDGNLKISFKPITGIYRHPAPKKLYKITLLGNREVVTTHCHSLFVLKDGEIKSIPSKNLKVGDFVVVPREVPESGAYIEKIDLVRGLLKLPPELTEDVFIKGVSESYRGIIPFRERMYDLIPFNVYRKKKVRLPANAKLKLKHGNGIPIFVPVKESLVKILGYWIAEGYTNENGVHFSLGTKETEIIKDIKDCVRNVFSLETTITHPHKTAVHLNVYNKLLAKIFDNVFKLKHGARFKEVPELIFNLPRKLQLEFLRSYFKGDGYFRRNYEIISDTASKELSIGLQYLLSVCGISYSTSYREAGFREFPSGYKSETAPVNFIYTQANPVLGNGGKNTAAFLNFIPIEQANLNRFGSCDFWDHETRRGFRRNRYITFNKARSLLDLVPNGGEAETKRIAYSNLGFLAVKSIEEVSCAGHEYVYDFCVEGYENFVGGYGPIFLHNSIGGVPGDETSMVLVPIIAAAGLTIPKTSSRAITSPAGTADRFECLAPVELELDEIKKVVHKTNGCLVWGGSVDLAPADDLFIKIEYPLSIDPLLLPSVMSKKKAVGAKYLVIDIPTGEEAKVKTTKEAESLAERFIELGKMLKINTVGASTFGEQPIGFAIGPALEAREALCTLMNGKGPGDLVDKVTHLAGILLDFKLGRGGNKEAMRLLRSGKAYKKLKEIIAAQGGDPGIKPDDLPIGSKNVDVKSTVNGTVGWINNSALVEIARASGTPKDKGAGILLHKKMGDRVKKGDILFEVYADKGYKLERAMRLTKDLKILGIGERFQMLIEKIPKKVEHPKYFILER
ncbi:MAG: hypothetical protein JXC85_02920 [Candidatus Aenigmarchaeota archaeon]|nr:hypothetical protein [Candidatus Aenigmarchaeota archaeon]